MNKGVLARRRQLENCRRIETRVRKLKRAARLLRHKGIVVSGLPAFLRAGKQSGAQTKRFEHQVRERLTLPKKTTPLKRREPQKKVRRRRVPKPLKHIRKELFCEPYLGRGFKLGDCCGFSTILRWLVSNGRLPRQIIHYNPNTRVCLGGRLDYSWVFSSCGDIQLTDEKRSLRKKGLRTWREWVVLRDSVSRRKTQLAVKEPPPDNYMEQADSVIKDLRLPDNYAMLHPLFDARYHKYRNGKIPWWNALLSMISRKIPVLVTGPPSYAEHIRIPSGGFSALALDLPPMVTMALINKSKLFIGGETGWPLWAGVMGVPVAATWAYWGLVSRNWVQDYRPLPLAAPVTYTPLNGDVNLCTKIITNMFHGSVQVREDTLVSLEVV